MRQNDAGSLRWTSATHVVKVGHLKHTERHKESDDKETTLEQQKSLYFAFSASPWSQNAHICLSRRRSSHAVSDSPVKLVNAGVAWVTGKSSAEASEPFESQLMVGCA